MRHIDYVHVCNMFSVSNNKNISKVKETQDKKFFLTRNSATFFLEIWVTILIHMSRSWSSYI